MHGAYVRDCGVLSAVGGVWQSSGVAISASGVSMGCAVKCMLRTAMRQH